MSTIIDEKMDVLINILEKVNSNMSEDAETALMYIRKSAETICASVFEYTTNKSASGKMLNDFILFFNQKDVVPEEIIAATRAIQVYCNPAAHFTNRIEQYAKSINPALQSLMIIVDWFFKDFLKQPVPLIIKNKDIENIYKTNELMEKINISKTIRIGCIPFPPFINYHLIDGEFVFDGYYYELFNIFAADSNIKIEYIPIRNEIGEDKLLSGEIDILACWINNEKRKEKFLFLLKNFQISIGGMIRNDYDKIANLRDLKNPQVKILTCKGEIGDYIVNNKLNIPIGATNVNRMETSDLSQLFKMIEIGISDIVITDNITCQHFLLNNPGSSLKNIFLTRPIYTDEVGLTILKNQNKFGNYIEMELKKYVVSDKMVEIENQILEKYKNAVLLNI